MQDDEHAFSLPQSELPELEPICCDLANGHAVKIEARLWPQWRSFEEWAAGVWPEPYFGIRIYCTQDTLPKRLSWVEEFRDGLDFDVRRIHEIWQWLNELTRCRTVFEFDGFDDFVHHVSEGLADISSHEMDATEHYEQLPGLTAPQWFDHIDDSIFNDQNDAEPER